MKVSYTGPRPISKGMEELVIEGKTYLSSKRAAKVSGYAKDYIGQLCREGRVEAKLVGRSWYVYEPSLKEHQENDERKKKGTELPSPVESRQDEISNTLDTTWDPPSYEPEVPTPLPSIEKVIVEEADNSVNKEEDSGAIGEMQAAWQEWFSSHPKREERASAVVPVRFEREVREIEAPEAVRTAPIQSRPVPVHHIVSDIAPVREIKRDIEPSRPYAPQTRVISRKRKKAEPLIGKAMLIALMVFSASIVIVETGLIDSIHIGGIVDSPIVRFLQGSQVIEK